MLAIVACGAGMARAQDCDGDRGVRLEVPATAEIGSSAAIRMHGPAGAFAHFMVSLGAGPTLVGASWICLDFPLVCDHVFEFDARGEHGYDAAIGDDLDLVGTVYFVQFLTIGSPRLLSNLASCRIVFDLDEGASRGASRDCSVTSLGLTPLGDLGRGTYLGEQGGLWPQGSNDPPRAHRDAGTALADAIEPLDANGRPSSDGRIVVAAIGFSGSKKIWAELVPMAQADPTIAPAVHWLDLCLAGEDAIDMSDAASNYWTVFVPGALDADGVTAEEVQVLWIMTGAQGVAGTFPARARTLERAIEELVLNAKAVFPNAAIAFLSPVTYKGYAVPVVEPETYENGFAIKWAIEAQLAGGLDYRGGVLPASAPWLTWSYYPWCDGIVPSADGLDWVCRRDTVDGVHPSPIGARKIAQRTLDQWQRDPAARPWLLRTPPIATHPVPPPATGARR
ncbi:MAG: hypothetical protein JNL90_10050 [Planctomycetes bacterium]|nr:hypothetical protein [Planctomycetota bacterium]